MMTKTYSEKLKDPRWQRKRLEVFSRDDFTCHYCGNNERTIHVHHLEYEIGKEPWEVSIEKLITVCDECHDVAHMTVENIFGTYDYSHINHIGFKVALDAFFVWIYSNADTQDNRDLIRRVVSTLYNECPKPEQKRIFIKEKLPI